MQKEKADKKIENACICGIAWGVLTVIFSLANFALKDLLGALLIFVLTFGIYKKNRTCAIAMLILWIFLIADRTVALAIGPVAHKNLLPVLAVIGVPFVVALTYFFSQGVRGTFAYHKMAKLKVEPKDDQSQ